MKGLTGFEKLTAQQIALECGKDEPTMQNIIDAVRIVTRCNVNRVRAGLEPLI